MFSEDSHISHAAVHWDNGRSQTRANIGFGDELGASAALQRLSGSDFEGKMMNIQ